MMELTALYSCVAALNVHQAKLTVCLLHWYKAGGLITTRPKASNFCHCSEANTTEMLMLIMKRFLFSAMHRAGSKN
ncbi:MAG: hypothetical protein K9L22_12910 [Methylococcaceae bacterium]|nr:hypothetical protein [Methylococcaceae bacterium]